MTEPTHEPSPTPATSDDEELLGQLADDFAARRRRGEHPTVEEYTAKYPPLAERIRKVLSAAAMMEQSVPLDLTAGEQVGSTIGRYKLLERIGEGGFGVVYMAEQHHPVRRKVALKVVKPGMDSRQVLARFEAERQALAIMDHENIAKVFDGGMTDFGRPYFVMELVKGEPITAFCDANQLSPRQRLELFVQVCHAVQHAHQKGIIHRDIKPTNVLVAMHDTTPVVKVIDFGVAKALGHELTERTLFTGFAQLLGTPLYMSPEQAGESALDVDTRSDIYSLGVLLYELLTGTTPFDKERFKKAAEHEIRRIIREEEPPRPSTRLSESKDRLPSISAQRHTEPAKLTKLVRGELDWIVMKALEKDRSRRYETATGLAADVQRYLADEQVLACPPSTGYRVKKFARRNKAALVTASVVGVALLVAVGSFGWMARDRSARHAKVAAQVELILAETDQLQREQKWPEALAAAGRAEAAVTGGEADAATARRVRERLSDLQFVDQLEQIRMQRETWLEGRFDDAGADRAYARAFRDRGVDVDKLPVDAAIARLNTRPLLAIPLAAALDDWVDARRQASKDDAANWKRLADVASGIDPEPLRNRLRATWGQSAPEVGDELGRLADSIDVRTQHPVTIVSLARNLTRAKRDDYALRLLQDAQRIHPGDLWINVRLAAQLRHQEDYEGAARFYTAAVSIRPNAAFARNDLGEAMKKRGNVEEAILNYRRAIEIDPTLAPAYWNLGVTLHDQKKFQEAVAAYRKAIELDPRDFKSYLNLGLMLCDDLKEYEQGAEIFRKAIELDSASAAAYFCLGNALIGQQKPDEAVTAFRKAIELDPKYVPAYNNLGNVLSRQGKLDDAVAVLRKAVEIDPKDARAHNNLGAALGEHQRPQEAVAAVRKAADLDPGYLRNLVNALGQLSDALWSQGKYDEAFATLREAMRLGPTDTYARDYLARRLNERAWKLATDPEPSVRDPRRAAALVQEATDLAPKNSDYWNTVGAARYYAGDFDGAVAALQQSRVLRSTDAEWSNPFFLAMAHWRLGHEDEARRWYGIAVEWMDKRPSNSSDAMKRYRGEAAELLGINPNEPPILPAGPSTTTAPAVPGTPKK